MLIAALWVCADLGRSRLALSQVDIGKVLRRSRFPSPPVLGRDE
jgi:hypothetical protein